MARYLPLQKELGLMFRENGWRYWSSLSIAGRLMEELGELAREMNHRYGDKRKRSNELEGDVEGELGDIIYTLLCFANSNAYDLDRVRQQASLYDEFEQDCDPMVLLAALGACIGKLMAFA